MNSKQKYFSFPEAADYLSLKLVELKEAASEGLLPVIVKAPYFRRWFTLAPQVIEDAYSRSARKVALVTLEDNEPGFTGDWETWVSWGQLFFRREDLDRFRSKHLAPTFSKLKEDFSQIEFNGRVYYLQSHQARIIEILYKRSKKISKAIATNDLLNEAELTNEVGEHRVDKLFRDSNAILFGTLIVRPKRGMFALCEYREA